MGLEKITPGRARVAVAAPAKPKRPILLRQGFQALGAAEGGNHDARASNGTKHDAGRKKTALAQEDARQRLTQPKKKGVVEQT